MASLTFEPIDEMNVMRGVRDPSAGATCVFVGTTRDCFEGEFLWVRVTQSHDTGQAEGKGRGAHELGRAVWVGASTRPRRSRGEGMHSRIVKLISFY